MPLTQERGQLLESLLPDAPVSEDALAMFLRERYSLGAYLPEVQIENDPIHNRIDEVEADLTNYESQQIVRLADNPQYDITKNMTTAAIEKGTAHSDIYRIYGQSMFGQGSFEEALDQLIDALRWNPENVAALIIVGNLYAKHRRDIDAARTLFEKAQTLDCRGSSVWCHLTDIGQKKIIDHLNRLVT
jgi:tetratricopeptide (TPR) repeat protein